MAKQYALVKVSHQPPVEPEASVIEIGTEDECKNKLVEIAKKESIDDFDIEDPSTWGFTTEGYTGYETFISYFIDTPKE